MSGPKFISENELAKYNKISDDHAESDEDFEGSELEDFMVDLVGKYCPEASDDIPDIDEKTGEINCDDPD